MGKITAFLIFLTLLPFIITALVFIWKRMLKNWRDEEEERNRRIRQESMKELRETFDVTSTPVDEFTKQYEREQNLSGKNSF